MLSEELHSLFKLVEKQVNDSPDFTLHLTGKPAIGVMSALWYAYSQALNIEQKILSENLAQTEVQPAEKIVRFDHWKAKHHEKRRTQ